MTDKPQTKPEVSAAEARRAREAEALRANLRRRKDQQRARAETSTQDNPQSETGLGGDRPDGAALT